MPEGWLQGKTAIVTGSGRGIGRGIALKMAEEGANVIVVDPGVNMDGTGSDAGPAQQVVDEIKSKGGSAIACLEAVGTMEAGERIIQMALDNFQKLDIVVNVAGILRDRMIFNMAPEEWDAVIQTHLKGTFSTVKPASILFRQQRSGRIINFCSITGNIGAAGQANYGAAKGGIAGMTRVVARDLGRYGVTVNAISPSASTAHDRDHRQSAPGRSGRTTSGCGRSPSRRRWSASRSARGWSPCWRASAAPSKRARACGADGHVPGHRPRLEHQRPDLCRRWRHGVRA